MRIARIRNGIVENIEVADQAWLDAQHLDPDTIFIPYTDDNPAHIGLGWTKEAGFEQPPQEGLTNE